MPKNPNQGGGSNRQGPSVGKQGKRGPITGKMTSVTGTQKPFRLDKGTNRSMPSHSARSMSSPSKAKGGWYLGRKSGRS